MREGSWEDCLQGGRCICISPDKQRAKSLVETADARIAYARKQVLDNHSARFMLESYYSSALEVVHAILFLKGYKCENHVCLGLFIRDILKRKDLFVAFDTARLRRNSVVYYGKHLPLDKATESIRKLGLLISEIKGMTEMLI
ncbi:hypothetical protein JW711_03840 [Candidatus Woesearchaeota archaeon]|nr:hypothetical protein [Candidatus Woesearchaeota archaeon]